MTPPAHAGTTSDGLEPDALATVLARIEARLDRLEASTGTATATGTGDAGTTAAAATTDAEAAGATAAAATTSAPARSAPDPAITHTTPSTPPHSPAPTTSPDDPYWVLTGMRERYPDDDVVLYAGTFAAGDGGYRWQYGLPAATILDGDFADAAPALSALAHPVRLTLLQAVLAGTHHPAELSALPGLGTSGQVYHHLNQLAAAGWLRSPRRGRWEVPGERTIPLLALVMAATS